MIASHSSTGHVFEIPARGVRGVVHQHVDAAESLDREADDLAAGLDLRQIAHHVSGVAPVGPQPLAHRPGLLLIAPVDDDACAERGEVLDDPQTDARGGAGDQRDFSG
jgi:hypothetical protein